MKLVLPNVPVLKTLVMMVEASQYNGVRLMLVKTGAPHELVLGGRGLAMKLDRNAWLLTDSHLEGLPLMAWTDFDTENRAGLHSPVRCNVLLYHAYAQVVRRNILSEVERRVQGMLRGLRVQGPAAQLVAFRTGPAIHK